MKNEIKKKYIIFVVALFLSGCGGCIFSERCYEERAKEKIKDMTYEERVEAKEDCVRRYKNSIDNAPNERRCTIWKCVEGKETWRRSLKYCLITLNNANAKKEEKTIGQIKKFTIKERDEYIKEYCITEFKSVIEFFPNEKEYCSYFRCDLEKGNLENILSSCIERVNNMIK
jgi:hypothetical protein